MSLLFSDRARVEHNFVLRYYACCSFIFHARSFLSPRKDEPVISTNGGNEETVIDSLNVARGLSHPRLSSSLSNKAPVVPLLPNEPSDLRFNRLRPSIDESDCKYKRLFGCYVAREALIDEEYWVLLF
jgi:hypothetical protein